jgi:dolichyl-phosphate-mannose-protein mannosyltransferase
MKNQPGADIYPSSFGGFASKYIKGKFFMDVHPPLAKMLITLAGWLAGFDGSFDFKDIGKDYLEPGVPYVSMRLLPAVCGILTIPTMFLTLKATGCRTTTAALGAGLVIFGTSFISRLSWAMLTKPRQRFTYSVAPHPPRLSSRNLHRFHRIGFHKLHKSA